jgi:thiosulfate reductase cytochrome b subunit
VSLAPDPSHTELIETHDRPRRLTRGERKKLGRLRARKVRRIVRHVDPWTVLKLSLMFFACLFIVMLVAGILLWHLAASAGTITKVEDFIAEAGAFTTFKFDGQKILQASILGGLVMVIVASGFAVLLAVLFNLISDLVGGIRFTVIEEETARKVVKTPDPPRKKKMRDRSTG